MDAEFLERTDVVLATSASQLNCVMQLESVLRIGVDECAKLSSESSVVFAHVPHDVVLAAEVVFGMALDRQPAPRGVEACGCHILERSAACVAPVSVFAREFSESADLLGEVALQILFGLVTRCEHNASQRIFADEAVVCRCPPQVTKESESYSVRSGSEIVRAPEVDVHRHVQLVYMHHPEAAKRRGGCVFGSLERNEEIDVASPVMFSLQHAAGEDPAREPAFSGKPLPVRRHEAAE